jgi:hypothetical protein
MGSIERRIEDLEQRLIGPAADEEAERRRAVVHNTVVHNILDEFAGLKASRAVHYRGGKRIEPEDIPGKILGPGYTTRDVWELAERRVRERGNDGA